VIIIATRWHSDDLIGRVLKNFPGKWENICFPAFATKELDEIGRHQGDVLFEQRYDREFLEGQKELLGSVFFHALYQQGPMDEIMAFTNKDWLKKTSTLPADDFKWARVWDLAASEDGGDWTCGTLCGYSKSTNNFIIGNIIRKQKSIGKVEDLVRATAVADGLDVAVCVEQEPGSSGKALVNHYEVNVLPEYKVIPVPAVKSKLIRAQPFLAACEAGKVYLHDQQTVSYDPDATENTLTWHNTFEKEFETFPAGEHDDQVDTAAAGYTYLSGKKKLPASWGRDRNNEKTDHKSNSRSIRKASFIMARQGDVNKRRSSIAFGRTTS
jgi:predicted phage terminase large subunit-like protein